MAQITGPAIGSRGVVPGQDTPGPRKDAGSRTSGGRAAAEARRQDEVVLSRQAQHAAAPSAASSSQAVTSLLARASHESGPARSLDVRGAQALSKKLSQAILATPSGAALAQANAGRDSVMAVLQ